jgi:hypothetical protein
MICVDYGNSVVPSGGRMVALEVFVDGRRVCIAGVGDNGVLNAIVNSVGLPGEEEVFMHVGGLDCTSDEHIRWAVPMISVGSEVTIRVVEAEAVDPPKRYPRDWDGRTDDVAEADSMTYGRGMSSSE